MSTSKKILIIEDEDLIVEAMSNKLKLHNYEVLRAANGEDGLFLAKKEHPDLILLDIIMPVMDGMTMLHKLREDEWGKNASVIMLTNLGDAKKIDESLKQGVYDFLIKSNWSINDILKRIQNRLGE